jgi:putative MFS transporter
MSKDEVSINSLDQRKIGHDLIAIMVLVGMGSFLDGYDLLNIGNALPFLTHSISVTPLESGLIGTMTYAGGIIGAAIFGAFADLRGKKGIFMVDLFLFLIGSLLSAFVYNALELIILRFFIGVAIGADIVSAPILLSDLSPIIGRGLLLGLSSLLWPIGALTSVGISYLLVLMHFPPYIIWRVILGVAVIPAAVVVYLRRKVPESPRWLLSKGRIDEYKKVMASLFNVSPEKVAIPNKIKSEGIISVFRKYKRSTIYSAIAWITAGTTSIFTIFTPTILHSLKLLSYSGSLLFTSIIWLGALSGSLVASLLQDRIGRKPFLLLSIAIMGVPDLIIGLTFRTLPAIWMVILIAIILFGDFMNVSVAYTIQTEVFPPDAKSAGGGIGFTVNRLDSFLLGFYTPVALTHGILGDYVIAVGIGIILLLVIEVFIGFETKQRSLEDILEMKGR